MRRASPQELLLAGYFTLTALLIPLAGASLARWWSTLAAHAAIAATLLLVLPIFPDTGVRGIFRAWLPAVALPLIYAEVAHLNDLFTHSYHDLVVQRWEAALFGSQLSITLRSWLPWKPLSEYLHFGYFGYYLLVPLLCGALYARARYEEFRIALTSILATFLFCYLVFIAYPVAGPWYYFERPAAGDVGWVFPVIIRRMLDAAASQGAALPSSHVAAAVVTWLLAWRHCRSLFWFFALIVPALVIGTVYGGFHYAVDALAGIPVGVAGFAAGPAIYRALRGPPRGADVSSG
ncbi:MAG: phosphatase PAP2 family protein [Gemmatimonadaceae bacterium]